MTELPTILNRSDIERNFPDPYDPSVDYDERGRRKVARGKGKQVRVI